MCNPILMDFIHLNACVATPAAGDGSNKHYVIVLWESVSFYWYYSFVSQKDHQGTNVYESGHRGMAVLLPGFAINW